MIEFKIHHNKESVSAAYREYWQTQYGLANRALLVITVVMLLPIFGGTDLHWGWYTVICILILAAAILQTSRETAVRMALSQLESLQSGELHYRLTETGLWEKTSISRVDLQWQAFAGWKEIKGFLLVLRSPADAGQFIAFPNEQLPPEAREFLIERLQADKL